MSALPPCRRVARLVSRRTLATAAVDASSSRSPRAPKPILHSSVILNRSPLLTPSPTVFERAFYAYQQRIRRALHNPFPSEFYFKPGSLLEARFNSEERFRERIAWGPTYAKAEKISPEKKAAEQAAMDQMALQEQSDDPLVPRVHPSDAARDYHSLDRKGRRNIYLLIQRTQDGKSFWEFPRGPLEHGELLHQAAQRELYAKCGTYMDTWVVARKPIGMYKPTTFAPPASPTPSAEVSSPTTSGKDGLTSLQEITFFFKAHIMAGQVQPAKGVKDFAWVTKQEIESRVKRDYWEGVKDMLSDH